MLFSCSSPPPAGVRRVLASPAARGHRSHRDELAAAASLVPGRRPPRCRVACRPGKRRSRPALSLAPRDRSVRRSPSPALKHRRAAQPSSIIQRKPPVLARLSGHACPWRAQDPPPPHLRRLLLPPASAAGFSSPMLEAAHGRWSQSCTARRR